MDETLRPASSSNAVISTRLTTNSVSAVSAMRFHGSGNKPLTQADR